MRRTMMAALCMVGAFTLVAPVGVAPVLAEASAFAGAPLQRSTPVDPRQKLLDDFASLNENLVEFALDGNTAKINETTTAIEASLPKLRPVLPATTLTAIESQMRDQKTAVKAGNRLGIALASVELYRLAQEAIDPHSRAVPVQVALLDYAGFKILALAKGNPVDWASISATGKDAVSSWRQLEARISSVALRTMIGSIMTGLVDAPAVKDAAYTAFAARMLLDSVDLLEGQFAP
jgi:hypothetical protein